MQYRLMWCFSISRKLCLSLSRIVWDGCNYSEWVESSRVGRIPEWIDTIIQRLTSYNPRNDVNSTKDH